MFEGRRAAAFCFRSDLAGFNPRVERGRVTTPAAAFLPQFIQMRTRLFHALSLMLLDNNPLTKAFSRREGADWIVLDGSNDAKFVKKIQSLGCKVCHGLLDLCLGRHRDLRSLHHVGRGFWRGCRLRGHCHGLYECTEHRHRRFRQRDLDPACQLPGGRDAPGHIFNPFGQLARLFRAVLQL